MVSSILLLRCSGLLLVGEAVLEEKATWNAAREQCRPRALGRNFSTPEDDIRVWVPAARRRPSDESHVWLLAGGIQVSNFCEEPTGDCVLQKFPETCFEGVDCGEEHFFECDDDDDDQGADLAAVDVDCEDKSYCLLSSSSSPFSCWSQCAATFETQPLAAARLANARCCCLADCCEKAFSSATAAGAAGNETAVALGDGLLGTCPLTEAAEVEEGRNNIRALAIFILVVALSSVTLLILAARRILGHPLGPPLPPTAATPANDRYPVHEALTVEARHAERSIVADDVEEVPVAKIIRADEDDAKSDEQEEAKGGHERRPAQSSGVDRRSIQMTPLPTAVPAVDDAIISL